jgi:hypothetical protein
MTRPRSFHSSAVVFTVVYSVTYLIAVQNNYALFTYHPALEEFGPLVQPPRDGPAMYWYGWIATAAIVALVAAVLARFMPGGLAQRLWSGWSWAVPIASMVVFSYMLSGFFTR